MPSWRWIAPAGCHGILPTAGSLTAWARAPEAADGRARNAECPPVRRAFLGDGVRCGSRLARPRHPHDAERVTGSPAATGGSGPGRWAWVVSSKRSHAAWSAGTFPWRRTTGEFQQPVGRPRQESPSSSGEHGAGESAYVELALLVLALREYPSRVCQPTGVPAAGGASADRQSGGSPSRCSTGGRYRECLRRGGPRSRCTPRRGFSASPCR
jgi:hypothetical protein